MEMDVSWRVGEEEDRGDKILSLLETEALPYLVGD